MTGKPKAPRMREALSIAKYEIRLCVEFLQRRKHGRCLPKRQVSRHVRKTRLSPYDRVLMQDKARKRQYRHGGTRYLPVVLEPDIDARDIIELRQLVSGNYLFTQCLLNCFRLSDSRGPTVA